MHFYEKTLNGKLEALLTFAETPVADQTPEEDANKVMHTLLLIDGQALMAADAPSGMKPEPMKGCALALSYKTADEAKRTSMPWPTAERSPCRSTRRSGRTASGWWTTASARTRSSMAV
jgi:hypothetical protein